MFINKSADTYLTANGQADLRAIIEKHDFSVKFNGKQFLVEDPAIQAVTGKGTAKWTGNDLSELLGDAVAARIAFDAEQAKEPEPQPEPTGTDLVVSPEPQPEPVKEPEPVAPEGESTPAPELSGDIELDDTGKRERPSKREVKVKEPFANRYERSARVLLSNLSMDKVELAEKAGMSEAMAQYMIESFQGTVKAFLAAGIIPKNKTPLVTYVKPQKK